MYKILDDKHPFLRVKTKLVKFITDDIKDICKNMQETMLEAEGLGLAANQVGIDACIIVLELDNFKGAMINPRILKKSDKIYHLEEGCLSIPGINVDTNNRAKDIKVEFTDTEGVVKKLKFKGLDAVVIQHEIDHLLGILMTDYLGENND